MSNNYTTPLCSCVECRETFSQKAIHTHYIRKHTSQSTRDTGKGTGKFQLKCSCVLCRTEMTVTNLSAHHKTHFKKLTNKSCPKCNATHSKPGTYCSRKCANSRVHSPESNLARSKQIKSNHKIYPHTKVRQCVVCQSWFPGRINKTCCYEHAQVLRTAGSRKGGRISAAKQVRRSKQEIELFELCADFFTNVTHNEPIFNGWDADIIIHDIQLAISWNGAWHYKQMPFQNHSLSQVQNRDRIKQNEIESYGWNFLVFEDRYFTPTDAFTKVLEHYERSNGNE